MTEPRSSNDRSHRLITALGGLAFAAMGLETAILSFAVLGMRSTWQLSPLAISVIIASREGKWA